jgi:hypothetical protein
MANPTLKDILLKDAANAKVPEGTNQETLPAGTYVAKVLGFVEEESYQYITVEIDKKKYNFFYNYYIKDTTDLDANLINWIKGLSTIQVTDETSLLAIANSAIGSSYKIVVYNYVSKTGKNAGKQQHAISFKDLPTIETVTIESEEVELPF